MTYVLGIDLGTSSLKGILMDEVGNLITTKSAEYQIDTPKQGYSEQRPEYWIVALESVLTGLSVEFQILVSNLQALVFRGKCIH